MLRVLGKKSWTQSVRWKRKSGLQAIQRRKEPTFSDQKAIIRLLDPHSKNLLSARAGTFGFTWKKKIVVLHERFSSAEIEWREKKKKPSVLTRLAPKNGERNQFAREIRRKRERGR